MAPGTSVIPHAHRLHKVDRQRKGFNKANQRTFHIQSANGTMIVEKEVHIQEPALNIWVWAQSVDDCPAVLSLGILCGKQGWNYEWKDGEHPTLSRGSTVVTLTPHHDVPTIFAARQNEENTDSRAGSLSASSCEGPPSAQRYGGGLQSG